MGNVTATLPAVNMSRPVVRATSSGLMATVFFVPTCRIVGARTQSPGVAGGVGVGAGAGRKISR